MNCSVAVPALVSCALPRRWTASHKVVVEVQKFTCPAVTEFDPAVTVAVAVTIVPAGADDTGLPPAVRDKAVTVGDCPDLTVSGSDVVAVCRPEVPVIVSVLVDGGAEGAAVRVSVLVVADGFGEKEAVTPVGNPLTT